MSEDRDAPRKDISSIEKEFSELQNAAAQLKSKIAEARTRNDMPLDSTLGNPRWDKDAADGHLDLPDDDDDEVEPPAPSH